MQTGICPIDFEKFVESSDTIFWQTDREGRIVYINRAVESVLGYSREEFIGKILPPDIPDDRIEEYTKVRTLLCSISPRPFERVIRPRQHKNGHILMLEISGRPQFDDAGNFTGYIGQSREVSGEAENVADGEGKFFGNEIFWESIISTLPIRFFWKDRLMRYSGANQLFLRDLGFRRLCDIVGKDDFSLERPDIASACRRGDFEIIHLGEEFHTEEMRIVTYDGHKLDIAIYKSPLKDYEGNVIGVAGAYIDVTASKNQERELREYLDRLRNAQEMAHIGYWDIDPSTGAIHWSDGVYRIFGYDDSIKPTITLEILLEHVVKEDRARVKETIEKALTRKNYRSDITYRIVKKNGEIAFLHSKAEVSHRDGRPLWIRGIVQDITEMKRLQIENEKKQALLTRQSRLVQMGQLLNNIAHQWKQPLAELNALILDLENDFAEGALDRERLDHFLEEVEQTTSFMGETIENFRAYVTPSAEVGVTKPGKTVHEVLKLLKFRSEKIGIRYEIDVQEDIETFGSDQDFIHIFLILLNNAMDAFERNGVTDPLIEIRMQSVGSECEITVKDNAGGIDEKIVEYIFDPYFTSKFQEKGSGIGLFMAKAIVETRLQGRLELTDHLETTFKLTLKGV